MKANLKYLMAMLLVAIFAVGCVSAAEDVTTDIDEPADDIDDIAVEDVVESEEVVELQQESITTTTHNVTNNITNISGYAHSANYSNRIILNFTQDNYNNFSLTLNNCSYVEFHGNGQTLIGDGLTDMFTMVNCTNIVIKDFIINVNDGEHGIYGHHIYNSEIINNTIINCEDAINIYQIHKNLTITDNIIYNFTEDGISLVNFETYSESNFTGFIGSIVSRNIITGGNFGMFFGGNFKGVISDNTITGSVNGTEFKGKKSGHNGRLNVTMSGNNITGASTGINMFSPCVEYLNFTHNNVYVANPSFDYAIDINANFTVATADAIHVTYCNFTGYISLDFYLATDDEHDNDGFYNFGI